jgi:hypothetical protein
MVFIFSPPLPEQGEGRVRVFLTVPLTFAISLLEQYSNLLKLRYSRIAEQNNPIRLKILFVVHLLDALTDAGFRQLQLLAAAFYNKNRRYKAQWDAVDGIYNAQVFCFLEETTATSQHLLDSPDTHTNFFAYHPHPAFGHPLPVLGEGTMRGLRSLSNYVFNICRMT